ncbi:MAG TPA: hypothetical protein DGG94_22960 [Micromonosporaceae bacterium]|nr:hypothetical protein [Micromonosporaceae bacterium]HCU52612.1 hypothetical protein [Micromonosporaceae bacterium]
MPLIAMVSAKGSPGVSTTALACTLTWPVPTLLAECDPAGGDLLSGYLARYELPTDRGVLPLAGSAIRGTAEQDLPGQLIDLDSPRQQRMVLPGITDPAQSASLNPGWARLGEYFATMPATVIVDCGRLAAPNPPIPLLAGADMVLLVLRSKSIRTISPAVPAIALLKRELADEESLGLLVVGDGIAPRELVRHLQVPVIGKLAWDPSTAAALCGDGKGRRRGPLMRSAMLLNRSVHTALAARQTNQYALARRDTDAIPVIR